MAPADAEAEEVVAAETAAKENVAPNAAAVAAPSVAAGTTDGKGGEGGVLNSTGKPAASAAAGSQAPSGGKLAKADAEEKEKKGSTLGGALMQKDNRDVAKVFAAFAFALAAVPILGLLGCERLLRTLVPDDTTRWMYSGALAVLLVNLVMASYVLYCFFVEGFPEAAALAQADAAALAAAAAAAGPEGEASEGEAKNGGAAAAESEPKKDR
eukprot:TRINITY_DN38310_c0_g1_i1.p1 TRINITY_DN38310_c0_g1~~TRINITY_DN38310_c0_g1_i1.p1  ORF type:complete len:212 (+),score=70.77 TRINITY_DN38310_c0_g1_i1:69-704(+)